MGTLRRSAAPSELFQAVRAVAAGSAWLEPGTAARLAAGANDADTIAALALSERELDVAAMIAEGRSNKEISTSLNISEPTVKKYVGRLLEKLRVEDRLQAGLYLTRHPLVLRRRRSTAAR
jgi:DNA-binding NarL/FixJ family response regulator